MARKKRNFDEPVNELERLKSLVLASREYFAENYRSFIKNKEFIFLSTLTADDKSKLASLNRPQLEFNITEAYVSRLRGEFSTQNPQMRVEAADGKPETIKMVDAVTNIARNIAYEAQADNIDDRLFKDIMAGFAVMKVSTEYRNDETFEQKICLNYVYDATLCGFDPSARKPHKGDGNYCYELVPMRVEDFKEQYPDAKVDFSMLSFARNVSDAGAMNWSYRLPKGERILYVCDLFEKKFKTVDMVLTEDDRTMTLSDYQALEQLNMLSPEPMVFPGIKIKQPRRILDKIMRHRFIESEILESKDAECDYLELVFFDGDSVNINQKQITRSYLHNVKDAQRAKNILGNTILDDIQNMSTTSLAIAQRGLPTDQVFLDAYIKPDTRMAARVWKDMDEKGPIPAPFQLQRVPMPPEVMGSFQNMDMLVQAGLGTYDAALGINGNDLSGKAIIAGANNSNAAAKPRLINFIASYNQVIKIIVAKIPKYYVTPMSIPIIDDKGQRTYQRINDDAQSSVKLDYSPNDLNVYVEEGVSFHAQKQQSLQTMTQLAQALPGMNQLLSGKGLPTLLDNLDVKGADKLKELAQAQIQQAEEAAKKQPQMPNPAQLKMAEMKMNNDNKQKQFALDEKNLALQEKELIVKLMIARQEAQNNLQRAQSEHERSQANEEIKRLDVMIDLYKFHVEKHHQLSKEERDLHKELKQPTQNPLEET